LLLRVLGVLRVLLCVLRVLLVLARLAVRGGHALVVVPVVDVLLLLLLEGLRAGPQLARVQVGVQVRAGRVRLLRDLHQSVRWHARAAALLVAPARVCAKCGCCSRRSSRLLPLAAPDHARTDAARLLPPVQDLRHAAVRDAQLATDLARPRAAVRQLDDLLPLLHGQGPPVDEGPAQLVEAPLSPGPNHGRRMWMLVRVRVGLRRAQLAGVRVAGAHDERATLSWRREGGRRGHLLSVVVVLHHGRCGRGGGGLALLLKGVLLEGVLLEGVAVRLVVGRVLALLELLLLQLLQLLQLLLLLLARLVRVQVVLLLVKLVVVVMLLVRLVLLVLVGKLLAGRVVRLRLLLARRPEHGLILMLLVLLLLLLVVLVCGQLVLVDGRLPGRARLAGCALHR